jgi:hypothetical protein
VAPPIFDLDRAEETLATAEDEIARVQAARLAHAAAILNDRVKLFATWLNTTSAGMATIGTITPIAAWFYGLSAAPEMGPGRLFLGGLTWFIMASGVHCLASLALAFTRET